MDIDTGFGGPGTKREREEKGEESHKASQSRSHCQDRTLRYEISGRASLVRWYCSRPVVFFFVDRGDLMIRCRCLKFYYGASYIGIWRIRNCCDGHLNFNFETIGRLSKLWTLISVRTWILNIDRYRVLETLTGSESHGNVDKSWKS